MAVGENIRKFRKEKGLTQKRLGQLCGIDEANIRKYELGKANPKIETVSKISSALGVTTYEILGITIEQLMQPLKDETCFLNYLSSLGYEYIDTFHTNDYGYDRCIHDVNDNIDIPLTKDEYENLKLDIKEDIEKEIRSLRRYKNL